MTSLSSMALKVDHRHQDWDHYGRNLEGHEMFYEKSMITEQKFCLFFPFLGLYCLQVNVFE